MTRSGPIGTADADLISAVLATIDEAVGIYDAEDRLIMFNAHYADVRSAIEGHVGLGVPWIDLVRASVAAGKIPEAIGREEEWLEARRRRRGSYSIVRRLADGRAFQVNERRMTNGGIAVVWTDITALVTANEATEAALRQTALANHRLLSEIEERKSAEAALTQLNDSLEQRVEERTVALQGMVAQRDLLLREVYHRVKNNLQIVDSLLHMEMRRLSDPDALEALGNLRKRVLALGLVHAQLMTSDDLKTFDIAPFLGSLVHDLCLSLDAAGQTVRFETNIAHAPVTMDFAIPVGLIVTELVTNAYKHSIPLGAGGVVRVDFIAEPDVGFTLLVADNGRTPDGPNHGLRQSSGTGSKIIAGLVRQLDGHMTLTHNNGTSVTIELPWSAPDA